MEYGKLSVGRGFHRAKEKCMSGITAADEYVAEMTRLTGEYIDQFTTVPDLRTIDEILSRIPKCCIGHKPKPSNLITLKPANKYAKKPLMVNRRFVWEGKEDGQINRR